MDGNIIKSFLVGLGFEVDEKDLARFNKAISGAGLKVAALATAIQTAAGTIFYGISKVSEGFEQLGYEYRIISPMINKTLQLRQAMLEAFKAAGINITQAVQASVRFNFALAKTKYTLEAIYKSVAIKFLPLLTKQMDVFRKRLTDNMPRIQASLEKFVGFVFKAFDATLILGGRVWSILERVYDFFVMLHKATDGWSTVILGAVAAWKLLNLAFLTTPLGLLITGLTALLALWDDLQTFKEGGKSLFNWGPVIPYIDALVEAMKPLLEMVTALFGAIWKLLHLDFQGALGSFMTALQSLANLFTNVWEAIKQLASGIPGLVSTAMSGIGNQISGFLSGTPNLAANIAGANNPTAALPHPIGSTNVQNSSNRQNVSQETNIIVQGSADANATGKAIAGEQSKVNFDMARNMRGSTR